MLCPQVEDILTQKVAFRTWLRRHNRIQEETFKSNLILADAFNDRLLLERFFKNMRVIVIQNQLEREVIDLASKHYNSQVMSMVIRSLQSHAKTCKEKRLRKQQADQFFQRELLKYCLCAWKYSTDVKGTEREMNFIADIFSVKRPLRFALSKWRARLHNVRKEITHNVHTSILYLNTDSLRVFALYRSFHSGIMKSN